MDKAQKLLSNLDKLLTKSYGFFIKLAIGVILLTIFFVSCVQIIDRRIFHEQVKEIAKEEVRGGYYTLPQKSFTYTKDSIREKNGDVTDELNSRIIIPYINVYNTSKGDTCLCNESPLDILSKSDGLLSANGLTFCITLIVSLLASLVLLKIETNEKVIKKTIQKEISSRYINSNKFTHLLVRIESLFNLSIMISNLTISLPQKEANKNVQNNIGNLCSRLSLICSDINTSLTDRKSRLDSLADNERVILNTYLDDTLTELTRLLPYIKNSDLLSIINSNICSLEDIKDIIDSIEKQS